MTIGAPASNRAVFRGHRGFTLIELLLVIVIIGILASVALPKLTSSNSLAEANACKASLQALEMALESYYADHGEYPPSSRPVLASDMDVLVREGYLKSRPRCLDEKGDEVGLYGWRDALTPATDSIHYGDGTTTTDPDGYTPGRAFCTKHGTLSPKDWHPNGR